eukprot:6195796-Pleurochrysis_carterae.AAC.3
MGLVASQAPTLADRLTNATICDNLATVRAPALSAWLGNDQTTESTDAKWRQQLPLLPQGRA